MVTQRATGNGPTGDPQRAAHSAVHEGPIVSLLVFTGKLNGFNAANLWLVNWGRGCPVPALGRFIAEALFTGFVYLFSQACRDSLCARLAW